MNSYPKLVKKKLDQYIQHVVLNREKFVRNPKKDFTRNRKLSLKNLVELIITMGAGSQNKELLEFFLSTMSRCHQHQLLFSNVINSNHWHFSFYFKSSRLLLEKQRNIEGTGF